MPKTHWKSADGIEIPILGTPQRKEYEGAFKQKLDSVFGGVHNTLRKLKVPLAQINEYSGNDPVNKDRLNLYTRMARGGDRLPPVVVRRNPNDTFDMIDGSHRRAAAHAAGLKGLDAYELVPRLPQLAVKKSLNKMAISDIKPGLAEQDHYTYSHVLHPDHVAAGYRLNVHPNTYDDGSHELMAELLHHGSNVGIADGVVSGPTLKLAATNVASAHRGKGLGLAMYEALYAHARHGLGATHVEGDDHSTSAHGVHQKLARKHGLQYSAPSVQNGKFAGEDFDGKFGPYQYALKSEPIAKMAIADIPPGEDEGAHAGVQRWNYSHVLPEAHHDIYRIHIEHRPKAVDVDGSKADGLRAVVSRKSGQGWKHTGAVAAEFHPNKKQLWVDHANVIAQHRGKGLGLALYEALYAHGRNVLGAKRVAGGEHSSMAAEVHAKLSRKHGLGYAAKLSPGADPEEEGAYDDAYAPYNYALKSEKDPEGGDPSFDFGANAAPPPAPELPALHVQALKSIKRMKGPKRDMAHAWFRYTQGHTDVRPVVTPDLERHLARFGIVDPQGYGYDVNGRSLAHPTAGRKVFNKQPDELRRYKLNSKRLTYHMRYQKAEEGEGAGKYHPDDLADGIQYIADSRERHPGQVRFKGIAHKAPTQFIDDVSHMGGLQAGWLKRHPPERWAEELKDAHSRPFEHIIAAHRGGQMAPGIEINGEMADGRGRALFHHALGLPTMPVAVFQSAKPQVTKAEDARRLPPAEQHKLRKALRMNKAKKLRKSAANLRESSPDTLASRHEVAGHMLGFAPHMYRAFKAARFLMGGEPATLQQIRRVLWDHDGDATAAAIDLYGMPDNEASRKALTGHQSVADLDKGEGEGLTPKHALAVVPASVRAAACLSRAFEDGSYQTVKLNGKHSTGSILASDPETGLTFLLKPGWE